MKREWYFRHKLERMFIVHTIVPAVVFIPMYGLFFMTMLPHGKKSGNIEHNRYVADLLDDMLAWCENGVGEIASQPGPFDRVRDQDRGAELSRIFYGITNSLGLGGDLLVMDSSGSVLLSGRSNLSPFLDVPGGMSWDIFDGMDREPNRTALKLAEGRKNGGGTIVVERSVMDGNKEQGHILRSIPSDRFKALVGKPNIQTIIVDPFGWAYVSNNYSFLNSSNQVMKVLMGSDRYLDHKKQMYLVSRQRVPRGGSTVYSISDIQSIVILLGLDSGLVITTLVLMTLWMLLNSRKVTEIKTEDFYKILDVMENVRDGDLEGVIRVHSDNEFKIITDAYNETVQNLRIQVENNRGVAELVSMAQDKQLESQFSPHFLYNTLENIRYMCKLEPAAAERMMFSLSNFLRYSLDGSKAGVTLKEGLEHLESYLTTLKRRFGERSRRGIDIGPETMNLRIPKLVLQPMIESAVRYGFGKQLNLTVELKVYTHEGKLIMIYWDDGAGIPQCTLSGLTALLEQKENPRRYSGLYNTYRRINTPHGRPYRVEIRSMEGYDTTLVMTLLVKREESDGCYVY